MIETVEAVMPVRLSGEKERLTARRLSLFLESFSRYWDDPIPLKLTIVGVPDEIASLRRLTRGFRAAEITILDERELIDHPAIMATMPWNRQMFIKLLFARICSSDAYLYLDADVICVGRLRRQTFVRDGKAVSDWEPKRIHPIWWQESRRLLGKTDPGKDSGFTVTPNVLTRELAAAVPDAVAKAQGRDAIECLGASFDAGCMGWAENTIYTELGEMTGALERLHHDSGTAGCYRSAADVWYRSSLTNWRPTQQLSKCHARFLVVQSATAVSPIWLRWKLAPLLYGPRRR